MGLIHIIKSFGLTIRESATDGSDFSNPDADYRVLFLGEDGQLHVKDSAGSVTDIGGAISEITDIPTAEMDDTLVMAPDGAGGVEFRAEGGGPTLVSGRVERTAGDLTSTSDSFADATGMSITLTTGARRVLLMATMQVKSQTSTYSVAADFTVDGTRVTATATWGLVRWQAFANNTNGTMTAIFLTDVLTAAEHTFKLQWRAEAGNTGTVYASSTAPLIFSAQEML